MKLIFFGFEIHSQQWERCTSSYFSTSNTIAYFTTHLKRVTYCFKFETNNKAEFITNKTHLQSFVLQVQWSSSLHCKHAQWKNKHLYVRPITIILCIYTKRPVQPKTGHTYIDSSVNLFSQNEGATLSQLNLITESTSSQWLISHRGTIIWLCKGTYWKEGKITGQFQNS